jgi:hypothetical protein
MRRIGETDEPADVEECRHAPSTTTATATATHYHGRGISWLPAWPRYPKQRLIEALTRGDEALIEARCIELLHVLHDRQAIIDAIKQYEQHLRQSV